MPPTQLTIILAKVTMTLMSTAHLRLAAVPVLALLAACGEDPAGAGPVGGDRPSVVTTIYPLEFVAERVGGADITLTSLAAPGVEPHDLELSPQQVGTIADAGVIVYLGGFAPAVDEAIEQNAADRGLDVASVVDLRGSADLDPHFWLDPVLLGDLAARLADRLGTVDPAGADVYAERAAALVADLDQLDVDLEAGLASCAVRTMVTAHDAFGYFTERYGLEQISLAGLEPDAEPSAARIAEVQAEIAATGVTTVYFEPLGSSDAVDAIAGDLGLDAAELDPIESVDQASGEDYLEVMRRNLATLRQGQGCS